MALPHTSPDDSDSSESESSTSGEESDEEAVAETSTDDEDDDALPDSSYFNQPTSDSPLPESIPFHAAVPTLTHSPSLAIPHIVADAAPPTSPTQTTSATPRRGLSLPGFMKRTGSSKSVTTTSSLKVDGDSDVAASTSADNTDPAPVAPAMAKKKRFSRKKKAQGVEAVVLAGAAGSAVAIPARRKKSQKRHKGKDGKKDSKLSRRGTKRDYRYADDGDMFGLVQIEVKGATDLPRFKNSEFLPLRALKYVLIS